MKPLRMLLLCAVVLTCSLTTLRLQGATSTNVTSRLFVLDTVAAPVFFSDWRRSGSDVYRTTSTKGKTNQVLSVFQPGGDWQLDTTSGSRAVWLDLGDPSLPFNAQYVPSLLTTHCSITGTTPVGFLKGVGSSTQCAMSFRINWGTNSSVFYRIHFNSVRHPGTGDIAFSCNQIDSAGNCIDWTSLPADNDGTPGDGRNTGELDMVTSAPRTGEIETFIGEYAVFFQMHITKP